ncbi:hypothetical protein [Burkholderia thailandensis]|uniref:hypothetical protein n=1 Tax=Burkholderia thailandensis TaxID=57975 RepID=UPI0003EC878E|nr:hypothetical protein [Burkholderia thailandensis]AHI63482.1 hypothetical protein BTL_2709 [Burkholderia thailandensis H0587]AOJ52606.1 cell wall anchor protein [Burkholderia thailandensis]AVR26849.1 cell wall anchor protein [Burkholderia thailandensis]MCZ2894872.1 cell wall anchor protein [Burkholderia thailandensis]TGB35589.1 cell wall anchor protein [Burkholderia thailandensis]
MKRTLIAAAVLASATGSVFAAPSNPYLYNVTGVIEHVEMFGAVGLFGCVSVSSTAGAVINNNQTVTLSRVSLDPLYQSYTKGAVTTTYNNEFRSVSDHGSASYMAGRSSAFDASYKTAKSSSSTSDSSSWSRSGSQSASSSSANGSLSVTTSKIGLASNGGTASVSGGANLSASEKESFSVAKSFVPVPHGFSANGSENESVTASISGSAHLNWGKQTYSGQYGAYDATKKSSTDSTSSASDSSWSASHSDTSASSSSSGAMNKTASASFSKQSKWNYNDTRSSVDVTKTGSVTQYVDTRQAGTLTATTGDKAATGVTGNLGVNVAEGIDNAQSNDVALASVDVGNVFGNAQIFSRQSSSGQARVNDFNLNASIGDGSLAAVSGNVGVNVASGIGNVQNNSLAGAMTTIDPAKAKTVAMIATDDNSQIASAQVSGRFVGTAMLGANTLTGATGNIGVNIAGGVGNLQHNGLAIAALNSGH